MPDNAMLNEVLFLDLSNITTPKYPRKIQMTVCDYP